MDIDFVILWVDGNDVEWKTEKNQYSRKNIDDSNSDNRYRDWNLLPYWFRAVEKFAPWVRRIHFVTWGHLPKFLNVHNPKIHIVKHEDFIPKQYLPTFSSHAIEMNIHRIPGLSEHFVYFNDDMFLIRPVQPSNFFKKGLPCTYAAEVPIEFRGKIGVWQHAVINNLGVINRRFEKKESVSKFSNKYMSKEYRWQDNIRTFALEKMFPDYFIGFKNLHAPTPYLKRTFQVLWKKEPELLNNTCMNKFRSNDDVNQWVALWWQIASGRFMPKKVDNIVNSIDENTVDNLCKIIEGQQHDMLCLNDPEYEINFEFLSKKLQKSFEKILPDQSMYEVYK